MTCPKCNGTGEDWTNVSTTSGALNGEDCSCREPTPADEAECRRALEEFTPSTKTRLRVEFDGDGSERASEFYADWVRQEYDCEVLTSEHFDGRRIVQWALGGNAASVGWAELLAHTLEDAFTDDDAPPSPRSLATRVWLP